MGRFAWEDRHKGGISVEDDVIEVVFGGQGALKVLSMRVAADAGVDEIAHVFRVIMYAKTYHPNTIDEVLPNE